MISLYIVIYLIGSITSFIWCKYLRNQADSNKWSDVFNTLLFAAASWIGALIISIVWLIINGSDGIQKNIGNPPKWL